MARTYAEFVSLVRDWANRDSAALSDDLIQDCLRYAADKAYRKLRIAKLEATVTYDSDSYLQLLLLEMDLSLAKQKLQYLKILLSLYKLEKLMLTE